MSGARRGDAAVEFSRDSGGRRPRIFIASPCIFLKGDGGPCWWSGARRGLARAASTPRTSVMSKGRLAMIEGERHGRLVFLESLGVDDESKSIGRFLCDCGVLSIKRLASV